VFAQVGHAHGQAHTHAHAHHSVHHADAGLQDLVLAQVGHAHGQAPEAAGVACDHRELAEPAGAGTILGLGWLACYGWHGWKLVTIGQVRNQWDWLRDRERGRGKGEGCPPRVGQSYGVEWLECEGGRMVPLG